MKKKMIILLTVISVFLMLTIVYYFVPKTFGKNVNPSIVDHINVFDGNTGTGFTITNPEDIKYIVENIQSYSMRKDGISIGRMGYSFKISYIDCNDKEVIPVFTLNSDDTIRKDPFFYRCDEGLCFDFINGLEPSTQIEKSASDGAMITALATRVHKSIQWRTKMPHVDVKCSS